MKKRQPKVGNRWKEGEMTSRLITVITPQNVAIIRNSGSKVEFYIFIASEADNRSAICKKELSFLKHALNPLSPFRATSEIT